MGPGPESFGLREKKEKKETFELAETIIRPEKNQSSCDIPTQLPEISIEQPDIIRKRLALERLRSKEAGNIAPIVFAYSSGLLLEFTPIFDGLPSIESFIGTYSAKMIIPNEYDKDHNTNIETTQELREITRDGTSLMLEPDIIKPTLSQEAKNELSYSQNVEYILSDRFSVSYDVLSSIWLISVDTAALENSERNILPIFHELGHIPYMDIEGDILEIAITKAGESNTRIDYSWLNDTIAGSDKLTDSIAKDILLLDPDTVTSIKQFLERKSFINDNSMSATKALTRELNITEDKNSKEKQKALESIINKLSIFSERIASAKALAIAHRLGQKEHGEINFEFDTARDMIAFFHKALESYAKINNEPRYHTGF